MIPFANAQELHKEHPDTFYAPSSAELDTIANGSFVKVCTCSERFWVLVHAVNDNEITGEVNNDLLNTEAHGLSLGDVIAITKENVYNILPADEGSQQ